LAKSRRRKTQKHQKPQGPKPKGYPPPSKEDLRFLSRFQLDCADLGVLNGRAFRRHDLLAVPRELLRAGRAFPQVFMLELAILLRKFGAGDGDRTRNIQLGNLNFRSFIFNTYRIAKEKCTCMRCMPCMHCLICVSLGDVWGTVWSYDSVLVLWFERFAIRANSPKAVRPIIAFSSVAT
jgi:hypothetical protein